MPWPNMGKRKHQSDPAGTNGSVLMPSDNEVAALCADLGIDRSSFTAWIRGVLDRKPGEYSAQYDVPKSLQSAIGKQKLSFNLLRLLEALTFLVEKVSMGLQSQVIVPSLCQKLCVFQPATELYGLLQGKYSESDEAFKQQLAKEFLLPSFKQLQRKAQGPELESQGTCLTADEEAQLLTPASKCLGKWISKAKADSFCKWVRQKTGQSEAIVLPRDSNWANAAGRNSYIRDALQALGLNKLRPHSLADLPQVVAIAAGMSKDSLLNTAATLSKGTYFSSMLGDAALVGPTWGALISGSASSTISGESVCLPVAFINLLCTFFQTPRLLMLHACSQILGGRCTCDRRHTHPACLCFRCWQRGACKGAAWHAPLLAVAVSCSRSRKQAQLSAAPFR
jgi:hypothetical protein